MATIVNLDIKNFRGIKDLSLKFKRDQSLICLIGRGDSGKTTVLDAISSVLSPVWNLNFYDTDFFNCDYENNIEITASLVDMPEKLLSENKFGLYQRGINPNNNEIIDDIDFDDNLISVLTIKLTVDSSLEPKWFVTHGREQEDKPISGADRALLNCFMISDYVDRHFSWSKGGPLYSLQKLAECEENAEDSNVVMQSLRTAKKEIDKTDFESLNEVTTLIKSLTEELGLDISKISTTLDSRELLIKEGKISLHEETVPFRQMGKGSKRLSSIAIQSALVRNGGIMLIDEIEQGLEPDRAKHAIRSLNEHHRGQIFVTTHSREVITELGFEPLLFLLKDKMTNNILNHSSALPSNDLQGTVRACPEAFFAKKVIVCEGATEVGICRAIDLWRRNNNKTHMSVKDCAYIDGEGNNIEQRVDEINAIGIHTAIFCDSDLDKINDKKKEWMEKGVSIFDCDDELCIEQQIFKDMPWEGVKELLQYAKGENKDSFDSKFSSYKDKSINEWDQSEDLRTEIISVFQPKKGKTNISWFKKLHHGEAMGTIIFRYYEDLSPESRLKKTLSGLSDWIDGEV